MTRILVLGAGLVTGMAARMLQSLAAENGLTITLTNELVIEKQTELPTEPFTFAKFYPDEPEHPIQGPRLQARHQMAQKQKSMQARCRRR